jgi:hypothetical protein
MKIKIMGGVAYIVGWPEGVEIEIWNYDYFPGETAELAKDDDDNLYAAIPCTKVDAVKPVKPE